MSEDATRVAEYHDGDDVEKAIHGLSVADHERLRRIAKSYAMGLGHYPHESPAADLLQEAVMRTLEGKRRWRRGVDFIHHLDRTMKSIGHSWRKRHKSTASLDEERDTPSDLSESGVEPKQVWLVRREVGPHKVLSAKEALNVIGCAFRSDSAAAQVIDGWRMDLTGPEIQELSGMSKKEFDAAVRRIRYRLPQLEIDNVV